MDEWDITPLSVHFFVRKGAHCPASGHLSGLVLQLQQKSGI